MFERNHCLNHVVPPIQNPRLPLALVGLVWGCVMQDRIKEYLAKAEWCEEQAENAADLKISRFYLTLAQGWRDFAGGPLARHTNSSDDKFSPTLTDARM